MGLIGQFQDDFADNLVAAAWGRSYAVGSATYSEAAGRLTITLPSSTAGTHEAAYSSTSLYDFTGDGCYINIQTMVATGVAAYAFFAAVLDGANYLQWAQQSNTLKAQTRIAGVTTDRYSATWSATTYKYLRIRESGGSIFFDSSTNGTTWTQRFTMANPLPMTALRVNIGANCGNVASPGTFKLDDFNLTLPALTTNWRWQQIVWPLTERFKVVTLACDVAGTVVGYIVTADTVDASDNPSGNVQYWSGPADGGRELTLCTTQAQAQAMAVEFPLDGRFDLPTITEARCIRVYDRSNDGGSFILREVYPRRLVQSDDIEAEAITALHIGVIDLDADHRITAGHQVVALDDLGVSIVPTTSLKGERSYVWRDTSDTVLGGTFMYYDPGSSERFIRIAAYDASDAGTASTEDSIVAVSANAVTGKSALVQLTATVNGTSGIAILTDTDFTLTNVNLSVDGGLNVGTATGAAVGQVKSSGVLLPHNSAAAYSGTYNLSLANNGVMAIGLQAETNQAVIIIHAGGAAAMYALFGGTHTTTEIFDPAGIYSPTAATASSINIYWSATNSRYELENKRGGALIVRIWIHEAA